MGLKKGFRDKIIQTKHEKLQEKIDENQKEFEEKTKKDLEDIKENKEELDNDVKDMMEETLKEWMSMINDEMKGNPIMAALGNLGNFMLAISEHLQKIDNNLTNLDVKVQRMEKFLRRLKKK